jgi:hypothetical protein
MASFPGERAPDTHWSGGWVGPRAGLDAVEDKKFFTLPRIEPQQRGFQPVASQDKITCRQQYHLKLP